MKTMYKIWLTAGLAMTLAVSGCGGDDDDNNDNGASNGVQFVPDSASLTADSFVDFLRSQSLNDETSEPLGIRDNFVVPSDEINSPRPLT